MFVRFVVAEIDDDLQHVLGVFQAIDNLRRRGVLQAVAHPRRIPMPSYD